MKVRELMTQDVVAVSADTLVDVVARLMHERGISGIPVVDADRRVLGIVTDLDLILRNARFDPPAFFEILDARIPLETPSHWQKRLRHMLGAQARDVMTESFETIAPDAEAEALATLLVQTKSHPIPVIEHDRLVGIVSRADLVRLMAEGGDHPTPDQ